MGLLTVTDDNAGHRTVTSRDAAGNILVNGGSVKIAGGKPTVVANTTEIDIFGLDGGDNISVNEANGPMPAVHLVGGNGDDKLTGGDGTGSRTILSYLLSPLRRYQQEVLRER
ncbi:MAG: hypothetical protein ACREDY_17890 [Bradyrhizobium sp.]